MWFCFSGIWFDFAFLDWNLVFHIFHRDDQNCLPKTELRNPADCPPLDGSMKLLIVVLRLQKYCAVCHDLKFFSRVTLILCVLNLHCPFDNIFLSPLYCVSNNSASLCQYFIYFTFQCCLLHSNSFVFSKAFVFVWVTGKNAVWTMMIPAVLHDKNACLLTL